MRTILHSLITLIWGLWFGGVMTLFLAVTAIFRAFPHEQRQTAGQAAQYVFRFFNAYQLALAAAALLATFVWCLWRRGPMKLGLFLLFGLVTFDACIIIRYIAPKIELLTRQGLTASPDFVRMHQISMILYLSEAVLLLVAGLFLPWLREPNV
jgi:putative Mn2+ efflux pump MntP